MMNVNTPTHPSPHPPKRLDRIQQLPIAQLEALAEALLDFTQLNDLVNWLGDDR